jgi:hypothetical protein
LAGFISTGIAERSEEIGKGSTPRKGAGSIATDAADSAPRDDLRQQPAKRVTDHRRLSAQLADHLLDMLGNLSDRLLSEHLWVGARLLHGLRVVRPRRSHRRVAGLFE